MSPGSFPAGVCTRSYRVIGFDSIEATGSGLRIGEAGLGEVRSQVTRIFPSNAPYWSSGDSLHLIGLACLQ